MRILQVCAEIYPLLKTGGLADVAGALPPALLALGAEARVLLPGFAPILATAPATPSPCCTPLASAWRRSRSRSVFASSTHNR